MGTRGPAPKRMAERLGHVTEAQKNGVSTVPMGGKVAAPACPRSAHPTARRWYRSLKTSGQTAYFEPSDWAAALYLVDIMTESLVDKPSAALVSAIWSAMESLLTTESARRRSRIEVQRGGEPIDEDSPRTIAEYKKMLGV